MTTKRQLSSSPKATSRCVRREDFMRDPRRVVDQAKAHGPVAITDKNGRARLIICIPTDVRTDPIR